VAAVVVQRETTNIRGIFRIITDSTGGQDDPRCIGPRIITSQLVTAYHSRAMPPGDHVFLFFFPLWGSKHLNHHRDCGLITAQ